MRRWAKTGNAASYSNAWETIEQLCQAQDAAALSELGGWPITTHVRVRPLDATERSKASSIVAVRGNAIQLNKSQSFKYSHCFDSMNGSGNDQHAVFERVGLPILADAWCGFNTTLLMYGSIGSGKTYSCVGNTDSGPEGMGLLPRVCEYLFDSIQRKRSLLQRDEESHYKSTELKVQMTCVEIRNDQVVDLLGQNRNVKVREDPSGAFLDGASVVGVRSFEDLSMRMNEGLQRRTAQVAAPAGYWSSRSHCIMSVLFTQKYHFDKSDTALNRRSKMDFVDLAGSTDNRTLSQQNWEGDHQAMTINTSLLILGQCHSRIIRKGSDQVARPQEVCHLSEENVSTHNK